MRLPKMASSLWNRSRRRFASKGCDGLRYILMILSLEPNGCLILTITVLVYVMPASSEKAKVGGSAEIASPIVIESIQELEALGISLEELTQLALANNPVIRQAAAATGKTVGYREQVGLYSNPSVGYNGSQLADRSTDQHTAFVTQDIVTGQKLERNVHVLEHEVRAMTWDAETQRHTVLSDVKQLYYQYLGAQTQMRLAKDFVELGQQGVDLTGKRKKAGEASQLDVLQTEIQLQQLKVAERQATIAVKETWKQLLATVGIPMMELRKASGELPTIHRQFNWDEEYTKLLESSPELQACLARNCRARANLDRQLSQITPNLSLMTAAGYDRGTGSQMINTQVSLPLPIRNRKSYWRSICCPVVSTTHPTQTWTMACVAKH